MGISTPEAPLMPDFSQPQRGFHHTVDSALEVLWGLGVSPSRITVNMSGAGWPSGWVLDQKPLAGVPLGPEISVALSVAGLGFFHSLPAGFWDEGGEAEPGTKEIVGLFDDPIQKLSHWIREGARLFDIQPSNYIACSRWIRLFGVEPDDWPRERWYGFALVLPMLHRLAGREEGIRFALKQVFDLSLAEIERKPSFRYIDHADLTRLAAKASRLGGDFILGNRVEDLASLNLVIGPVPLRTYRRFQTDAEQRCLNNLLAICVPLDRQYRVLWLVSDRDQAPRVGFEEQNSCLGVNSYLGDGGNRQLSPSCSYGVGSLS